MALFGAMQTAISGLNAQASAVSNISGNIANSQTSGYKRLDTEFEDLAIQSGARSPITGGVIASARATTQVQGSISQSENPLALAISGRGFLSVARPTSESSTGTLTFDSQVAYTRAGDFTLNRGGYLVNPSGYVLRGWIASAGAIDETSALNPIVVSRADGGGSPASPFSFVSFAENGDIEANYQNGSRQVIARVPVITFANSDALERLDGQAFAATRDSGAATRVNPNSAGAGRFVIGAVEGSNVDIASEFSKLIVAQRAYTGNTRVITTADQMLQDAINIVR